jgi:hypothetical protein
MGLLDGPTTDRRVVRHYKDEKSYLKDAEEMERRGYVAENMSEKAGKFNVGRTVGKAVVFLPWAILRPSRQGESVTVTWVREG